MTLELGVPGNENENHQKQKKTNTAVDSKIEPVNDGKCSASTT